MSFKSPNQFEFVDTSEAGNFESDNELDEEFLLHFDSESDDELDQTAIFVDSLGENELRCDISSSDIDCRDSETFDDGSQEILEESGAESTDTFEFITNQKGKQKLYADGFGFHRRRTNGPQSYWKCEFCETGCSASATTIKLDDGSCNIVRIKNVHNHLVDLDRKEKFIGR